MSKLIPVIATDDNWPVRTIREITTHLRRGTAPVYVDESPVLAIGQRCITDTEFDASHARPHSSAHMSKVLAPKLGDVLINSTGTGTIGRSVVFHDARGRYMVDGHVTVARPREGELAGRWLNDVLRSSAGQRYLETRCYAGSTNQIELSASALASMPIAVPSYSEQLHIAEILDTLDARIRATKLIISKLGCVQVGLLQSLLQTRIVGKKDGVPAPPDWRVAQLAEVVSAPITYGIVQAGPHVPGGVPYVRTGDMNSDRLSIDGMLRTSPRIANDYARSTVRTGELICAIRATVGKVLPVPSELDGANLTQGTARIAPGPSVDARYLYWEMRGERVQDQIALAIKGTTFLEITLASLKEIRIAMPDLRTQQEIAKVLDATEHRMREERGLLAHLEMLKTGLVSDLLTGRVRVPYEVGS